MNLKQIREMIKDNRDLPFDEDPAFWIYDFEGKFIFDSWENQYNRIANAYTYMTFDQVTRGVND